MFDRIAVIRRDELAMRLIGAVREHDAMHGSGTRVIARARRPRAGDPYLGHGELPLPVAAACGRRSWAK